jgi:hypothetical protein
VTVGGAAATTFTIIEQGFKATSSSVTFESLSATVRCPITLEGTFNESTFAKRERARIGVVNGASLGTCTGGTARALTETLPWNIQYLSFTGTLPNITSANVRLTGASFQIAPSGLPACLMRSTEEAPVKATFERETEHGIVSAARLDETVRIALTGEGLCRLGTARLAGSTSLTALDGRTGTQLLLGGQYSLQVVGVEGSEMLAPEARVFIPRETEVGTLSMQNNNSWYEIRILEVTTIVENVERFVILTERTTDCKRGTSLAPGRTRTCNIRVLYPRPERAVRPLETHVQVTYEWGIFIASLRGPEFFVRACREIAPC